MVCAELERVGGGRDPNRPMSSSPFHTTRTLRTSTSTVQRRLPPIPTPRVFAASLGSLAKEGPPVPIHAHACCQEAQAVIMACWGGGNVSCRVSATARCTCTQQTSQSLRTIRLRVHICSLDIPQFTKEQQARTCQAST
jgi:hypothetical protein